MPLLDDLVRNLPLGNPAFHSLLYNLLGGAGRSRRDEDRHQELLKKLEAIGTAAVAPAAAAAPAIARPGEVAAPASMAALGRARQVVVTAAGDLKEAMRFAREDGPDHPEVKVRLGDAAAQVTDLERFELAPERVRDLPAADRAALEAVLPEIRDLRQRLHDADTGLTRRYGTADLQELAADAGTLATKLRVAAALTSRPLPYAASVPTAPAAPGDRPYSLYAPDMALDTGCLPCGTGHWAAIDSGLRAAAAGAAQRGDLDSAVQARLTTVEEELEMMTRWDWTPERIAKTPPGDRAILEVYAPAARGLYDRVKTAATPADLAEMAKDATALRQGFREALQARPPVASAAERSGGGSHG